MLLLFQIIAIIALLAAFIGTLSGLTLLYDKIEYELDHIVLPIIGISIAGVVIVGLEIWGMVQIVLAIVGSNATGINIQLQTI